MDNSLRLTSGAGRRDVDPKIEIRYLRVGDIADLIRLSDLCWSTHNYPFLTDALIDSAHWRYTRRGLFFHSLLGRILVAEMGGEIVGYAQFGKASSKGLTFVQRLLFKAGSIGQLYVHPEHCGKKIGSRLFTSARKLLKRRGLDNVLLSCLEENQRTRAFYERLGGIELEKNTFGPEGAAASIIVIGFGKAFEASQAQSEPANPSNRHEI